MKRDESLDRVRSQQQPYDVLVIGGGATGLGTALDAASRGLTALLLEQHDFAKGTSSAKAFAVSFDNSLLHKFVVIIFSWGTHCK